MILIPISRGYLSVKGRLHTRYAPVRRSCTPERALPLDLHVLGLPLAFILSQDQTLHCIFVCPFFQKKILYFQDPGKKINSNFVFPIPEGTGVLCFLLLGLASLCL